MKVKAFVHGSTIVLVAVLELNSTVNGRIQLHGHQHGDVLARILHKPTASSGSSILVTATDQSIATLPDPTEIAHCFGADCILANVTIHSQISSRVTPVPQIQVNDSDFGDAQMSSRHRQRLRVRAATGSENSNTELERRSSPSGELTEASGADSTSDSTLQRNAANIDKAMKSTLVQGAEDHGFPAFGIPNFHRPKSLAPRQDDGYQSFVLGGFTTPNPTSSVSAATASMTAYGGGLPTEQVTSSSTLGVSSSVSAAIASMTAYGGGLPTKQLTSSSTSGVSSSVSAAIASMTAYGGGLPTKQLTSSSSISAATASVTAYGGGLPTKQLISSSTSAVSGSESVAMASMTAYGGLPTKQLPSSSTAVVPSSATKSSTSTSSTTSSSTASSVCSTGNGTTYTSAAGINYQIVCNTDYTDNNLPFQLANTFAGCLEKCDAWNFDNHDVDCIAAIYVPNRGADTDDCYLKSKLVNPSAASGYCGALRIGYTSITSSTIAASNSAAVSNSAATTLTSVSSSVKLTSTSSSTLPPAASSTVSSPGITYASGNFVIVPKVFTSHLHGPSQNTPTQQYLDIKAPAGVTLASSLLTLGDNGDLTTDYDISGQTGVLDVNISTQSYLAPLTNTPHLSRDGGRGGMVNGEHLFIFCDTGSYSTTTSSSNGNFLGFVSSSVATDVGMKGLTGDALSLQDGIGQWSDDAGRMRGFAPLTEGEVAYNQVMQGQGQRYAVWPEADIIPLDARSGIMYAPVVYDNVNEFTKAAVFTYTGATLLTITAGGKGGPVAQRTVEKIFQKDEVEWGCSGGIRSWGPSGIGGDDGKVYLFGNVQGGILLARVSPDKVADRKSITYWNGGSWTNNMLTQSSTSYFIEGAFMDVAVFYSPRHLTFIIVYLTFYADSTFYYRILEADHAILPPFAPGGDYSSDYVENILKYKWSEQQVLYKAPQGLSGKYIYAGGPHLGYYGSNDIINGGTKMLLSWSAPTGLDPSTLLSEYQILTAEIDWA